MRMAALLVLLTTASLFLLPTPLPLATLWLALPALILLLQKRWPLRWLGISLLALSVSTAHFNWLFSWQLPTADIQKDIRVEGRIVSLPEAGDRSQRFVFALERYGEQAVPAWQPATLRLSWYEPAQTPQVGERWQFTVRLKPPRGSLNFQGFDYERWLFAQHVRATGYVREKPAAVLLTAAAPVSLQGVRQNLREQLLALPLEHGAVIAGLSFGADDAISPADWRLFRDTGTTHLVAISGLHITLIAAVAGFLFAGCWRLFPRLCLFWPAPLAGIVAGLVVALAYSALAGFSTPTLRSVLMLAVIAFGWVRRRQWPLSSTLSLALILTLLLDPCALLEPGFWLSFGAVGLLFLLGAGRPIASSWWWAAVRVQMLLSLALLPLTLLWFGQASLVSPLANLLAVPWVSFVSTPLALLGCLLLDWLPSVATLLLHASDWSLSVFFRWLEWLAGWQLASIQPPELSLIGLSALLLASLLLVAPWTPWRRLLPLLLLVPMLEWRWPDRPLPQLTLLDVGQGTAVILETDSGVLLYDSGPRGERFDAGDQVVVPALRALGWSQIDQFWLSHADTDHAGGAGAVLAALPARQVWSGEPVDGVTSLACLRGQQYALGQLTVTVLHPTAEDAATASAANDRSCVLRIQAGAHTLLLTGDISADAEATLLAREPNVAAELLLVPHHGSAGSSSPALVAAVQPRYALVSAGYRNPHRHPRPEIVARYQAAGAVVLNTTELGAIRFDLSGPALPAPVFARQATRLWRGSLPE
ncbi:DNA internalization-related competence protein ComEC/Rec2 [Permianibacter sp. IMCC34836]|uniref:DNA internalization-related competence protein ComEC/Rec2 n=1 Tax=Permianibacter fluminis TaxID=2738515 RepID=UPI001557ABD3|nr:DNA internalization-related competence protein ComEC/Rec2 [Permianibacter fluminis]NQD37627.1 DNA internalization-related competence protein ComEC/Rec2 [Permianibacter fluminis]